MDIINKIEKSYFTNNMLTEESWKYIIGIISKSINENKEEWVEFFGEYLKMYLSYKYFTKKENFVSNDKIDEYLKLRLKNYYSALISSETSLDVLNKVKSLPIDLVYLIIRKCFNLSPLLKSKISVTKSELRTFIVELKKLRKKVANNINNVSSLYENIFNINDFKMGYNCGVFFEDNFINQGILEFVDKMFDNEETVKRVIDLGIISKSELIGIKEGIKTFPSFQGSIRNKNNCFEISGSQIGKRFKDFLDMLKTLGDYDYVVDNKSVFKEPYMFLTQNDFAEGGSAESDYEESTQGISNSGGGGGGDFSNTADISVPDMGGDFSDNSSNDVEVPAEQDVEELPDNFGEEG